MELLNSSSLTPFAIDFNAQLEERHFPGFEVVFKYFFFACEYLLSDAKNRAKKGKINKTLRGGIEPPRHFRTTGFPGLRPTARLPQQKVYLIY